MEEVYGLRPVDFIGEEYNKIKGKKLHYFVWLDHILAAVLLGRLILLCMAPHHTCISSLSSVCRSPQAQDHCLLLLAQQPSDKWFVPGAALQRHCCQEPVLVQQPSELRLLEWCGSTASAYT